MKITQLECWSEDYRLSQPYTIHYEKIDKTSNVYMRLNTDMGFQGWGCAAPDYHVTGETVDSVKTAFHDIIEPFLKGKDPFMSAMILEELKLHIGKQPSALALVDMALFDVKGKKTGEPVYRLLGGFRENFPTSITIGILPLQETLEKAREFIQKGFFILKLKGGTNMDEDLERVIRIRELVGPDIEIRFDANQGYTVEEAVRFIKRSKTVGLRLLEQPTDKDNSRLLQEVSQQISVPVMADESLLSLKDVFELTSREHTDMINIKLMKAGGISEAIRINAVAKAAGVESMVGCMDESSMGIAAGLHFALARPNIHFADLDGHFDIIDDPYTSMLCCRKGILYPNNSPGFGWEAR